MKRGLVFGVVVGIGLLCGVVYFAVLPPTVSPEDIQSSVVQTPELIDRAWRLPVATTFKPTVTWQSNGSRCGPAAVANAFRSIGEEETTEAEVLYGTGKCWTGICFMGLTLDELVPLHTGYDGLDRLQRR
jgi:hypothetical protein